MMSTSPTTLLGESRFLEGYRLEFHSRNDKVIAKLYQGESERGEHSLEELGSVKEKVKLCNYENLPEFARARINRWLESHHVPLDSTRVTHVTDRDTALQAGYISPVSPSSSGSSSSGIEEPKLPVGLPPIVIPSFGLTQSATSPTDLLFQQIFTVDGAPSLRQSLLSALGPSYLDVKDSRGYNLLLAAVDFGDQAKFKALLSLYNDQKALYLADAKGRNALHLAAILGRTAFIPLLIDAGLNPAKKDEDGLLPLHWAIHERHPETVTALLDKGASLATPLVTPEGTMHHLLELAIAAGDPSVLTVLLEKDRFEQLDLSQPVHGIGTLLHLAIQYNQASMLAHLLSTHSAKAKPLFNLKDPQGRTSLQLAAYLGDLYAIRLLLKHGADPHYGTNQKGGTAVHYAAAGEQPDAISLLDYNGVELQRPDNKGRTPILLLKGKNSVAARKCKNLLTTLPNLAMAAKTEPPKYARRLPFNLVLQGGGPRGIAYLGALEQMEKLQALKELKRVAGTSAGAITAAFLAVGCTAAELKVYLKGNLGELLVGRGELEQSLLKGAQTGSYRGIVQEILKEYWKGSFGIPFAERAKQFTKKLYHLNLAKLDSGEAIRKWIDKIIQEKIGIEHCTFKELKGLVNRNPETYKELHVFSTCILPGAQPQVVRFSHEEERWGDLVISDAIRASLSIPGVFQPHILHFKDATGTRHAREHYGQFLDGGLLRNYPLDAFDAEKYQEDKHFLGSKTNRRTLGLSLRDVTVPTEEEVGTIASSPDLVKALISTFYHAEHILMEETGQYKDRTIEIPIQGVGLLNFNLDPATKKKLIASGKKEIEDFFLARS